MSDPLYYVQATGLGVMQSIRATIDKFYAFFSTTATQTVAETSKGTILGVGVKGTSTLEVKSETKYQTTLTNYLITNHTNQPQGPLYKATTTVKASKVEKVEGSGKVEGVDIKASAAVKIDPMTRSATTVAEVSAGVGVGSKGGASGSVSVDTDDKRSSNIKMSLKVDVQTGAKTKSSSTMGIGFGF